MRRGGRKGRPVVYLFCLETQQARAPPRPSIGAGEQDDLLCLFAAADALFGVLALDDDAGGSGGLFLDLVFALAAAAPARLDEVAALHAAQQFLYRFGGDDALLLAAGGKL